MRIFSYRNKRALKRVALVLGVILLLAAVLIVCRVIYLERYITYTSEGAKLDYEQNIQRNDIDPVPVDPTLYPFETLLEDIPEEGEEGEVVLRQFKGYYITTTMLNRHFDQVKAAVDELDSDTTAVMVDAKSIFGFYYYHTEIEGAETADSDIDAVEALIADLTSREGLTVIARVPSFCDPEYALRHQAHALPLYSGALWTDENNCYWLNPFKNDVQGYLVSIAIELSKMGFDEILFDDFYVPRDDRIAWSTEITREDAILDAALNVSDSLFGYDVFVSFGSESPDVAKYASRVYVTTDDPNMVAKMSESMKEVLPNAEAQIVFLTGSRDTRFEKCSVLAPLLESE